MMKERERDGRDEELLRLEAKLGEVTIEPPSWAARIATRAGLHKTRVALARKLAVLMHRMLVDGTPFAADGLPPG